MRLLSAILLAGLGARGQTTTTSVSVALTTTTSTTVLSTTTSTTTADPAKRLKDKLRTFQYNLRYTPLPLHLRRETTGYCYRVDSSGLLPQYLSQWLKFAQSMEEGVLLAGFTGENSSAMREFANGVRDVTAFMPNLAVNPSALTDAEIRRAESELEKCALAADEVYQQLKTSNWIWWYTIAGAVASFMVLVLLTCALLKIT